MPDHPPPSGTGARSTFDGAFASLRGLGIRRNRDDKWLAGICSGIADRLGIDPLIVRGVLIVLLFVGGIGGFAYLVAWALLPDRDGRILAEEATHGHGGSIALLVVIGIVAVTNIVDRWWLWLVLVPVGVLTGWAVLSARAGKTPEQMGAEFRRATDRFVAAVTGPSAAPATAPTPSTPTGTQSAAAAPVTSAVTAAVPGPTATTYAPAPHAMGPGRSGAVTPPPRVVHRPRRRGGLLALLLTIGLLVAGYGLGSLLATQHAWSGSPELVGAAFALAGAGLALAVVGLAGRRAGLSVLLTTALAALCVLGTALPSVPAGGFGERRWVATSVPATGYTLTAGEATLSLAGAVPGQPLRVEMGAGELTVRVPAGTQVDVDALVRLGQLTVKGRGGTREYHGTPGPPDAVKVTVGTGTARVPLEIRMGAGEVTIVEES